MACCLIHNLIRRELSGADPIEAEFNNEQSSENSQTYAEQENIASIESSDQWTAWRDDLAKQMFDEWRSRVH